MIKEVAKAFGTDKELLKEKGRKDNTQKKGGNLFCAEILRAEQ